METSLEEKDRHNDEAAAIASISAQVVGVREIMVEKLESQNRVLDLIKEQTTKTNGHVAKAFIEIGEIREWKNRLIGGSVVLNAIILPLLMWLIFQHLRT